MTLKLHEILPVLAVAIVVSGCSSSTDAPLDTGMTEEDIYQLDAGVDTSVPCQGVFCYANAHCDTTTGQCACNDGYQNWSERTGCTEIPGPCEGVLCFTNAHCNEFDGQCVCNDGFENWTGGVGCTEIPGPCEGVVCFTNAHCDETDGQCVCNDGFKNWLSGVGCTGIVEQCDLIDCALNAHCEPTTGECVCDTGYMGDPQVQCVEGCLPDDLEDDDTSADATFVAVPCTSGSLSSISDGAVPDYDWFAFDLEAGDTVRFGAYFSQAAGDIDLGLFNYAAPNDINEGQIALGWLQSIDDNEFGRFTADTTGTYYVQVVPVTDGMCGTYTFTIDYINDPCAAVTCGTSEECVLDLDAGIAPHCECLEGYRRDSLTGECFEWCAPDLLEPNDSPLDATPVDSPFAMTGLTRMSGDGDWYSIEAVEGSLVVIEALFDHSEGNLELYLHDGDNINYVPAYSTGETDREFIAWTVPAGQGGTFLLEATLYMDDCGYGDFCSIYDLSIDVTDGDPCEEACPGAEQRCQTTLTAPFFECYCRTGYIWNEAGDACEDDPCLPDPCPENASCTLDRTAQDDFACECLEGYIDNGAGGCVLACQEDELSPNHTSAQATVIDALPWSDTDLGAINQGGGYMDGSHDWFKFSLAAGEMVKVDLTFAYNDGDIDIHLFDYAATDTSTDSVAGSALSEDNASLMWFAETGGDFYLRVRPYTTGMCNLYDISIEKVANPCVGKVCVDENAECRPSLFIQNAFGCSCIQGYEYDPAYESCELYCADDTGEDNDSRTTATVALLPFMAESLVSMSASFTDDEDWFTFGLNAGETVQVEALFSSANGDIDMYLYFEDDTSAPVATARHIGDNEQMTFAAENTGTYFVRVVPAENSSQCTPYDIAIVLPTP